MAPTPPPTSSLDDRWLREAYYISRENGLLLRLTRGHDGRVYGVPVLRQVMLVHEPIAANFAGEGRWFATLDASVLQ